MKFVGRAEELRALDASYDGRSSSFFPIYGRRRVGKTELILHFLKKKPGIYFLGKQAPAEEQIREFQEIAAVAMGEPLLAEMKAEGWKKALSQAMRRRSRKGKFVLALDEFQWMAAASPELSSVLQELWDLEWSRTGDVFLILCGSYLGFMEREVLGRRSPLFGRRSGQIKLEPFRYDEAAEFHPRLSPADRARTWFLCGGVPLYLRLFDAERSLSANISNHFLSPHGALYREAEFLLREELREIERYQAILLVLAQGSLRTIEIARRTGIPGPNLSYYLKQLVELGYLARRFPLMAARPPARTVRYTVADPVLRFWFRFIFPNASRIVSQTPAQAFDRVIRPGLDAYFGERFEALCREGMIRLFRRDGEPMPVEVGEFWDRDVQIDVVAHHDDERISVGECRWGAVRSWPALLRELAGRAQAYPNPRNWTVQRWLFTRQRCPRREEGCRFVALEDLYD